jgi:hypothetical protein
VSVETLVAEIVGLTADDAVPDEQDLAVRHDLPVATVRTTMTNAAAAAAFHTMPALYWCIVDNERRRVEDGRDVAPLQRPSNPPSPSRVDGAAALEACPGTPAGEGRDRPLGSPVASGSWTGEGGAS